MISSSENSTCGVSVATHMHELLLQTARRHKRCPAKPPHIRSERQEKFKTNDTCRSPIKAVYALFACAHAMKLKQAAELRDKQCPSMSAVAIDSGP